MRRLAFTAVALLLVALLAMGTLGSSAGTLSWTATPDSVLDNARQVWNSAGLPGFDSQGPQQPTPWTELGNCSLTVVLDTNSVPTNDLADWHAAVRMLAEITGMTLTVVERPVGEPLSLAERSRLREFPVIYLGGQSDVFREWTRAYAVTQTTGPRASKLYPLYVAVNTDNITRLQHGDEPGSRQWVFLHELGHVVGLDHSDYQQSLMYPATGTEVSITFQDIADLRSSTQQCRKPLPNLVQRHAF